MSLGIVGLSHRTAPIEVRERFHLEGERLDAAVRRLMEGNALGECVVLSTCNRTEAYFTGPEPRRAERRVVRAMSRTAGFEPEKAATHLFRHRDRAAVSHLYRVAAGLDSLVLGEHEIQGQVGDAYRRARSVDESVGPVLHRLFQSALSAGGRVRAATDVGRGAASVPSAAVELAEKVLGSLGARRVLVVGTGDMGALALRCLLDAGVRRPLIASRSRERARALAAEMGGEALTPEEVWSRLDEVDVLLASTASTRPFLTADRIRRARRPERALVLLDIAVPRNVEASAGDLPGVFLYNIDDLQRVVEAAHRARAGERPTAEAILDEEAERFWAWYRARRAAPLIRRMRERAEATRRHEIERALREVGGLSEADRERIHMASRLALNKILHGPTTALRHMARQEDGDRLLEAASRLLGLDEAARAHGDVAPERGHTAVGGARADADAPRGAGVTAGEEADGPRGAGGEG